MASIPLSRLTLRHLPDPEQHRFAVLGEPGGATREAVVPAAHRYPVPGRPDSSLLSELRWYLDRFLDYPFPPETGRAEQLLAALRGWGEAAFAALFDQRPEASLETLHLRIESDDPRVLAWPWEALGSRETGPLGIAVQMERSLVTLPPPVAITELPADRLEVLLVIAREGESDVAYRSVARPIVELAAELPIRVHVLRPPTLGALREHLRQWPRTYHVLHFDGHGDISLFARGRAEGRLVFEDDEGHPQPVLGRALAEILREHPVPLVVLNACRSAQFDPRMRDPFAAVAAALLATGTGAIIAMASELNVMGARELLPAFYRALCATGDLGAAVLAGRRRMTEQPERLSLRGRFPLQDWLVPVLYQRAGVEPGFPRAVREASGGAPARQRLEPSFVGRDGAILRTERLLRRPPYAVRIHGLAGVGKTAFARALADWLLATQGIDEVLWLAGGDLPAVEETLGRLARSPSERRRLLVLDGIGELALEERNALLGLLRNLRGGETPVIVTSRGPQDWWGEEAPALPLSGLTAEEAWELFEQLTAGPLSPIERNQPRLELWMDLLGGHPQALRALVPQLARYDVTTLLDDLRSGAYLGRAAAAEGERSPDLVAFLAPLGGLERDPGEPLASLRLLLAFHEGFVQGDLLKEMTRERGTPLPGAEIDATLQTLVVAGLLSERGAGSFAIHPALPGFLRARILPGVEPEVRDAWARAFTSVMGGLAYELEPRPFHRQDRASAQNKANFGSALEWARRLDATIDEMAILQWMASYAHQNRHFDEATDLFLRLVDLHRAAGERGNESALFHRLGMVAQDQGDLDRAEVWYLKSLQIDEELADAVGAARTSHQLGMLAQEKQDLAGAEGWFGRALATFEHQKLDRDAMATCHQLGVLAEARGNLEEAAAWYERGRALVAGGDDEHILARFENELSTIALLRGDLPEARRWGQQSLRRKLQLRDQGGKASGYHQLGLIAQEEGDLDAAGKYFHRSLRFSEELGQRLAMANSYHQLGVISQLRNEPGEARKWFLRSLELAQGPDSVEVARTHHHLGMVAQDLGELDDAEREYQTALRLFDQNGNDREAVGSLFQLGLLAAAQGQPEKAEEWLTASLEKARQVGDEIGEARAWCFLGEQAGTREDLDGADRAYRRFLELSEKLQLENFSAAAYVRLAQLALKQRKDEESFGFLLEALRCAVHVVDREQIVSLRRWLANFYRTAKAENRERLRELAEQAGLEKWLGEERSR
jgi:tetratricopeptide (TPR) repeat protein